MMEKKENLPLIIAAGILTVLVIACIVAIISMNAVSNDKDKAQSTNTDNKKTENVISTSSNSNNKTDLTQASNNKETEEKEEDKSSEKDDKKNTDANKKKDEEDTTPEEVKKINESEKMIYERIIDGRKVPTINLTTKYATKVNEEVEKIYKDNESKQYTIYSYCMYIETVTLILDNVNGSSHSYNIYNVNTATGKRLTNEKILEKAKISKEDFSKKFKKAYQDKYEELFKDQKSSSNYKSNLESALKNVDKSLEEPMYIDPYGVVCCISKFVNPANNSECEYEIELK